MHVSVTEINRTRTRKGILKVFEGRKGKGEIIESYYNLKMKEKCQKKLK